MKLKAYIGGKLYHSITVSRPEQLHDAFLEIMKLYPTIVYLHNGRSSAKVFPLNPFTISPIYYTSLSEDEQHRYYTIPTDPSKYPIRAHYPNGSTSIIGLS